MARFTESVVEEAALDWLRALGYTILAGEDVVPELKDAWRNAYSDVVLSDVLRGALRRINPGLPSEALEDAFRKLTRPEGTDPAARNRAVHRLLVEGVTVEYRRVDGSVAGVQARVLDFDTPKNNDWIAVNQFTIIENKHHRRPDVVLFVNGLPLAAIELKNAAVWSAWQQLQTYQREIPSLFDYNAALIVSDGLQARIGSLGAGREWFKPWRTIRGESLAPTFMPELQVLIEGVFEPRRFLDLIRYFIVFEAEAGGRLVKKMAGYHQFHAVNVALEETLRAAQRVEINRVAEEHGRYEAGQRHGGSPGDRRVGVVWHTQGSGKSLTMCFYAGKAILHPDMANPTIVVLTDRNDLDDQLFGTFARCRDLLRQDPVQAVSRADLRERLRVAGGGVVFTTIQKFFPESSSPQPSPPRGRGERMEVLSDRRNIVVIADEAHRSQYDFIDGFARHMRDALPNASFIGFTGTPVELTDKNTRAVFGDYISVYDIQRAVEDKATVPIYYESRLARLGLDRTEQPQIDPKFEEVTEGEEVERKEKLKSRWAQLEAVVGSEKRLALIARDIVDHFEARLAAMDGKAMVVCMSRRICMDLHDQIVKLRPGWYDPEDDKGALKVIMTGNAAEGPRVAEHARNKARREELAQRFRNPEDPFKLVIVRDMWLTGFDAPSLSTMYVDKPMRGHGLMQAIARVNRVFREKRGGLVVDYLGLAPQLKAALATYTESGGTGRTAIDQQEAVAVMLEKYEICENLMHGFDRSKWLTGASPDSLGMLRLAVDYIVAQENGKTRFLRAVKELSAAFALAVPHEDALRIRDDVAFFQAVRASIVKLTLTTGETRLEEDLDHEIRQIVSRAVASEGVIDIFQAAGLKKPDISILSEEFLAEMRDMPQRNLAVELLRKLLHGEIRTRARKNLVEARSFAQMLEQTIRRYQNRAIEAAQVIEELIGLAKDMRAADARGEALGLNEGELAFYDALETNDSAVNILGELTLQTIARELVATVRRNVTIDWTIRENIRAQLRVLVKRILRKYGYPPDKQEKATQLVLEQAETLSAEWTLD